MTSHEEKRSDKDTIGWILLVIGFVGALFVGWVIFPQVIFSKKTQPVNFSHVAHAQKAEMSCEDCHTFNDDGSYNGIPSLGSCAECHGEAQGETAAEKKFVEEFVAKEKQVPWLIYAEQPDSVYFSHAPHVKSAEMKCTGCHRDVTKESLAPPLYVNRITGYAKTIMKMDVCEDCHADKGTPNDCFTCHK